MCAKYDEEVKSHIFGGGGEMVVLKPGERVRIFHVDADGKVALNVLQRNREIGSNRKRH